MHPRSCAGNSSKSPNNLQHHKSGSQAASPHYNPYPKAGSPSFLESAGTYTLCVHCCFKGNRAASCASKKSSRPSASSLSHGRITVLKPLTAPICVFTTMSETHVQCNPQIDMVCTPAPTAVMQAMVPIAAQGTSLERILYIHTTPYVQSAWLDALSSSNNCWLLSLIWCMTLPMAPQLVTPPCLNVFYLPTSLLQTSSQK